MSGHGTGDDVQRFRRALAGGYGWHFDDTKLGFLGEVLQRGAQACGKSVTIYLEQLEAGSLAPLATGSLAHELTVAETYFFRNIDQFRAVADVVLPDRRRAQTSAGPLRLMSAGCASGEEPYSLAILAREHGLTTDAAVAILGVDVNPAVLEKAAEGCYSPWSLRETPADVQQRWFRAEGRHFRLDPAIRSTVRFEALNLAEGHPDLWLPDRFDVVFCRNVLMYFAPSAARALIERITRSLAPGGYLFLGHAETLRGLSQDFHLCHTHDTFYYQRKDRLQRPAPVVAAAALPAVADDVPPAAPDPDWAATWLDTVQRSADRIQTLTAGSSSRPAPLAAGSPAVPSPDLATAIELLKRERYTDALEWLDTLPIRSAHDPDVLLLRAALLTHSGQLAAAELTCQALLALDGLHAGAHYLLALCREEAGDPQGAWDHDQSAVYLDPAFAMPRLHLGLLARRSGERETARQELGQALMLLQREDTSRLLLFGGGFSREALVALCRAVLVKCGGTP
jgi:chemotaxis protein methyltransferase CheR